MTQKEKEEILAKMEKSLEDLNNFGDKFFNAYQGLPQKFAGGHFENAYIMRLHSEKIIQIAKEIMEDLEQTSPTDTKLSYK